jgi:hypothetical protein
MTGPALVYLLCLLTCAVCAGLLVRSWWKTRTRLLAWMAASFVLFAFNNFFLFADVVLFPTANLWLFRFVPAFAGVTVMIIAFIWEAE